VRAPYRDTVLGPSRFAPSVGWTRPAAWVLSTASVAVALPTLFGLFTDTGCPHHPEAPHVLEAFELMALTATLAWLGLALQRRIATMIQRRAVRARAVTALPLVPPALTLLLACGASLLFNVAFLFHICLEDVAIPWFGGGC